MSKVYVDPTELVRFIALLRKFNSSLEEDWRVLRNAWHSLDSTWRDPECDRHTLDSSWPVDRKRDMFLEDWGKVILQMEGYLKQAGDYVQFLSRLENPLQWAPPLR